MKWNEVTEERYMEMLEILPPAVWAAKGFLVAWLSRTANAR